MKQEYRRICLTVSYDGTAYSGWQRQLNAPSIQEELEKALKKLTGETVCMTGASRTDAGVHALGQTVHFDTVSRIPAEKFSLAINTRLPDDIRVTESRQVSPAFHARYGARGKIYRYCIHNSRCAPALERLYRAHVPLPLDVEKMHRAAQDVLGRHDFAAFAASGGQAKSTIREIWSADVTAKDELVELVVSGRSFLYNMVRILAGSLINIGTGKLPEDALRRALESKNRLDLGVTAPACGLTLMKVFYPQEGEILQPEEDEED